MELADGATVDLIVIGGGITGVGIALDAATRGLTIALDALGPRFMVMSAETGLDPGLMHRVAVIGAGALDSLPHNGAVVTLLAVCGSTHKASYFDLVMACVVSALLALVAVIVLGSLVGSF